MHAKTLSTVLKSERLRFLAQQVIEGEPMADVGTDHALLPIALVLSGVVPRAIAADLRPDPLTFARNHKRQFGLSDDQLDIRLGSGLSPIHAGEVATVVIAGMGGATMKTILEANDPKPLGVRRLILQPTQGAEALRMFLIQKKQWHVTDEHMLFEAGRYYTNHIIDLHANEPQPQHEPVDWYLGYAIRRRGGEVFQQWLRVEQARLTALLSALTRATATNDALSQKRQHTKQKLAWVNEHMQ